MKSGGANPSDLSIFLIEMKETEGFPPHFFTIHYYLLLSLQFIGLPPDKLQFRSLSLPPCAGTAGQHRPRRGHAQTQLACLGAAAVGLLDLEIKKVGHGQRGQTRGVGIDEEE